MENGAEAYRERYGNAPIQIKFERKKQFKTIYYYEKIITYNYFI